MTTLPEGFARRMVDWQRLHGRQSLPWQNTQDPYRVWLSEIMLQQTQVSTVLDYFPRFLLRFPDVAALAAAPQDDVLALWSGLGYYSRARNLHKCAQEVMGRFGGAFPHRAEDLQTLPGIGRSTAAAIAAFCFGERAAILDGNVKRVLTRVLGFGADLAVAKNEKALWALAQDLLPDQAADMPRYTQALMDLGATVCLPRKAQCEACPVSTVCQAQVQGEPLAYPVKTRKLKRSSATLWLLWAVNAQGQVFAVFKHHGAALVLHQARVGRRLFDDRAARGQVALQHGNATLGVYRLIHGAHHRLHMRRSCGFDVFAQAAAIHGECIEFEQGFERMQ